MSTIKREVTTDRIDLATDPIDPSPPALSSPATRALGLSTTRCIALARSAGYPQPV